MLETHGLHRAGNATGHRPGSGHPAVEVKPRDVRSPGDRAALWALGLRGSWEREFHVPAGMKGQGSGEVVV